MSNPGKSATVQKTEAPAAQAVTKSSGLVSRIANKYAIDSDKMLETLKATCFRQKGEKQVTHEQMMALLVIAEQYNLNPFTREIYAFASENGIVPIVGIDGWIRLINERPEFEAMELAYAPDGADNPWIECTIWRKDRGKPITIREYLDECVRDTGPWKSHPRRMLRHKAIIQCARVAFGYGGIYDPDEAERVRDAIDVTPREPVGKPATTAPRARIKTEVHPEPEIQYISADQATVIRDKCREEGIAVERLLEHVGLASVEEFDARGYQSALDSIDELSRARA